MKKIQLYNFLILLCLFASACNNSKKDDTNADTTLLIEEPVQPETDKTEVNLDADTLVLPQKE